MPISVVCPTYNTWGLMGGRRGIDIIILMEQVLIPGAQTCAPSLRMPYKHPISLSHAHCVTGRCGYLWNSQRVFQRQLTQQKRMCIPYEWIGTILSTNRSGKIPTPNLPLSNIRPRYARWSIPLIGALLITDLMTSRG